ncbi:nitroreductase family deazaflavin-dependent oxidoreductase [Parahaliea sp. F7430]|uniref:Nitroreductase family deazaflavin-dependent oxidoreductase n=1 Tax=Sediminihaliea albiluteola TaxID=2758564 RepID=A0A7W2YIQ7_9GAMM|nr:nitroreductase/quinone reductase family protein [Sediminihaliea albiluteola]MBA6411784.1 nitroreductase family deazaflavin-dependent oxidoreductase [Sediminihaliea albiluteola]
MLQRFVMSSAGLALDRFLVRWTGFSLTTWVFARASGYAPGPVLYLETIGRRSGRKRAVAVPYFDRDGQRLLVASKGGADSDPYWAQNLRANPDAVVRIRRRPQQVRARFLAGEERAKVWEGLKADVPTYAYYESLTEREIPVIALEAR